MIGAAMLLLSAPLTYAQTTAQLTGTVQDNSGAVIPGAQVTLTDEATRLARVVQTNRQGFVCLSLTCAGHLHREGRSQELLAQGNYQNRAPRRRRALRPGVQPSCGL